MYINITTRYKHISGPPLSVRHFRQLFSYPNLNFNSADGIVTTSWKGDRNYRGDIDERNMVFEFGKFTSALSIKNLQKDYFK
jgi:hypothetical protein